MKIFNVRLSAKKEPKPDPMTEVRAVYDEILENLHSRILTAEKALEAMRIKVYRDKKQTEEDSVIAEHPYDLSKLRPGTSIDDPELIRRLGGI